MKRIFVLVLAGIALGGPAQAGSSAATARNACGSALKEEFGAAKVTYQRMRNQNGVTLVVGRLEMTDGSTRRIMCRVRGQSVSDVRFDGGGSWSSTRPANAGYIESEEEKAAREKAEAEAKAAAQAEEKAKKAETANPDDKSAKAETAGAAKPKEEPKAEKAKPSRFKRVPER